MSPTTIGCMPVDEASSAYSGKGNLKPPSAAVTFGSEGPYSMSVNTSRAP